MESSFQTPATGTSLKPSELGEFISCQKPSTLSKDFVDDLRSKPSKLCRTHFTLMPDDASRKKKGDLLFISEKGLDLKAVGEQGVLKIFWSIGEKSCGLEDNFRLKTKYNYFLPEGSIIFGEKMLHADQEKEILAKFNETFEGFKLWVEGGFKQRFMKRENEKLSFYVKQQKSKDIKLYFLAIFNTDSMKVPEGLIQVIPKELCEALKKKKIQIGAFTFIVDVAFVQIQHTTKPQHHNNEIVYIHLPNEQHEKNSAKIQEEPRRESFGSKTEARRESFEILDETRRESFGSQAEPIRIISDTHSEPGRAGSEAHSEEIKQDITRKLEQGIENFDSHSEQVPDEIREIFNSRSPSQNTSHVDNSPVRRMTIIQPDQRHYPIPKPLPFQPPPNIFYLPVQVLPPSPHYPIFYGPPNLYQHPGLPLFPQQNQSFYRPQFPQHNQYYPNMMSNPHHSDGFPPVQQYHHRRDGKTVIKKEG